MRRTLLSQAFTVFVFVQPILILLRSITSGENYSNPILSVEISPSSIALSGFVLLLASIPIFLIFRGLAYISNLRRLLRLDLASIYCSDKSHLLWPILLIQVLGPYTSFSNISFLVSLSSLASKLFLPAYMWLDLLNSRRRQTIKLLFLVSTPFMFLSGSRSDFVYPIVWWLIGRLALNTSFKPATLILRPIRVLTLLLTITTISITSYLIRINRELGLSLEQASSLFLNQFNPSSLRDFISLSVGSTLDRLINWPIITSFLYSPGIGFDGVFNELIFIFGSERFDIESQLLSAYATSHLAMVRLVGWQPSIGFTLPVTPATEGLIRGGILGFILMVTLTILVIILTFLLSTKFTSNLLVPTSFILSMLQRATFSDSIYQIFKFSLIYLALVLILKPLKRT